MVMHDIAILEANWNQDNPNRLYGQIMRFIADGYPHHTGPLLERGLRWEMAARNPGCYLFARKDAGQKPSDKVVRVFHVRHGAQKWLQVGELRRLLNLNEQNLNE